MDDEASYYRVLDKFKVFLCPCMSEEVVDGVYIFDHDRSTDVDAETKEIFEKAGLLAEENLQLHSYKCKFSDFSKLLWFLQCPRKKLRYVTANISHLLIWVLTRDYMSFITRLQLMKDLEDIAAQQRLICIATTEAIKDDAIRRIPHILNNAVCIVLGDGDHYAAMHTISRTITDSKCFKEKLIRKRSSVIFKSIPEHAAKHLDWLNLESGSHFFSQVPVSTTITGSITVENLAVEPHQDNTQVQNMQGSGRSVEADHTTEDVTCVCMRKCEASLRSRSQIGQRLKRLFSESDTSDVSSDDPFESEDQDQRDQNRRAALARPQAKPQTQPQARTKRQRTYSHGDTLGEACMN